MSDVSYATLSFQHYFVSYSGSSATLSYSINGGGSWTVIQTWTATTANAATFNQDVSSLVAGHSNVMFKWNYTGTWGYFWAVDDISITGSSPGLWRGNTSSDWNTASNWDDGVVPSGSTNVTISPDALYWPTFPGDFTLGSHCNDLTLPAGCEMTANGDVTINAGCSLVFESDGTLNVSGDWNNNGIFFPGQGTVKFTGSGNSTISEPQPVVSNYVRSTFTKGMTALTSPTIGPTGDDGNAVISIGFTFNYCGTNYTNARICTNGWLSLNQSGTTSYINENLFTSTTPNTALTPWWDDLADDGTSKVNYKTTGIAPDRVFTAEWYRVKTFSTIATTRISFQVKLYESSNIIEFHYGTRESGTASSNEGASIGIEDASGGSGNFIDATTGSTTTGISNLKSATQWPTINYRFSPPASGSQAFQNLTVEKTGASMLMECDLIVGDTLTMTSGDIDCGSHTLELGTSETNTGALLLTSSNILGSFKRWIAASTAVPTDFPVGTATGDYNARITFTNNTGGTLTASFEPGDPENNSGFPLTDGSETINEEDLYTEGSWTFIPTTLTSTNYTLELSGTGFSSAGELDETVRILKRPDAGGDWTVDGTHVDGSPPVAKRSGLSGFSRFALAKPDPLRRIHGDVTYYNVANTPITSGVTVRLFQDDSQVGSDYIVTEGSYEFSNLTPGNYELRVSSSNPTSGSINTTDAAQVNYWGAIPYTIEKVRFYAGDVTGGAFFINSTDALRIQENFVNGNAFDKGNWAFWKTGETISSNTNPSESYPQISLSTSNVTADIYALCAGDFNRSFVPGAKKSGSESLELVHIGNKLVGSNQEFDFPIKTFYSCNVGAISLIFHFPGDLVEVNDVIMNENSGQLSWAVNNDELRIGWNSMNPLYLSANDEILTLKLKTTADFSAGNSISFSLAADPLNELADGKFNVIQDAMLKVDVIAFNSLDVTDHPANDKLSLTAYPNPFSGQTTVSGILPADGHMIIEVLDIFGRRALLLADQQQSEGKFTIKLNANDLSPGIYILSMKFNKGKENLIQTIRLVVTR